MRTLRSSYLAASFATVLLILSAVLSAQAVGHVSQHSHHHTSATHSTSLCSWYCAAGQVHGGDLVVVAAPILSFLGMENKESSAGTPLFVIPSPSRAPPFA